MSVTVPDPVTGKAVEMLSRRVGNDHGDVTDMIDQIEAVAGEHGRVTVGIDVLVGIARLVEVMVRRQGWLWCMCPVWRLRPPARDASR